MRPLVRHVSAAPGADVGLDYDRAGERYRAYADGDVDKLYEFDGQYAYGDQEIWRILGNTLNKLRARGRRELSLLDLGCGPGTWIRRIVDWAGKMGFTRITRVALISRNAGSTRSPLSQGLASRWVACDSRSAISGSRCRAGLQCRYLLCLYGVLSPSSRHRLYSAGRSHYKGQVRRHISGWQHADHHVDGVKALRHTIRTTHGRLQVEFQNSAQTSFPSHLFSAAEIRGLAKAALEIEELSGLDLFHNRFATDPDWNPAEATPDANFIHALRVLEHRFRRNPTFLDHATHLLLIARPKRS